MADAVRLRKKLPNTLSLSHDRALSVSIRGATFLADSQSTPKISIVDLGSE